MKKELLKRLLNKYNPGKSIEQVLWVVKNGHLYIKSSSSDKGLIVFLETGKIEIGDGEYPIFDTTELSSLVSLLGDDITITPILENLQNTPIQLLLSDGATTVKYALADPRVIPAAPKSKSLPQLNIKVQITSDMANKFVSFSRAIQENHFAVITKNNKLSIILGHSLKRNATSIALPEFPDELTEYLPSVLYFSSDKLADIFTANKDESMFIMSVAKEGLMNINSNTSDFKVNYFMTSITI